MADDTNDPTGDAAQAEPSEKKDGRHERVERGKRAVYEALVELFGEGRYNPPVAEVAARAGVSERTRSSARARSRDARSPSGGAVVK